MENKKSKALLAVAIALTLAVVLQLYGTVRYAGRMPGDRVGIAEFTLSK